LFADGAGSSGTVFADGAGSSGTVFADDAGSSGTVFADDAGSSGTVFADDAGSSGTALGIVSEQGGVRRRRCEARRVRARDLPPGIGASGRTPINQRMIKV
jgi:hypothetical protein